MAMRKEKFSMVRRAFGKASKLLGFALPILVSGTLIPPPVQTPIQDYGPWNRDLEWGESADGLRFSKIGTFVERGGVPSLARTADGRLLAVFQWFPLDDPDAFDLIALKVSLNDGWRWTPPAVIRLEGLPSYLYRSFDPTLVSLPDGRLRLYFSSERGAPQNKRGNRAIFSAVSSDGYHYLFEPGQRFGLEGTETYDCAVALLGSTWHLYCPVAGAEGWGYHATSNDGLNFVLQPNVFIPGQRDWLGNAITTDAGLVFYGSGRQGTWAGFSPDGFSWTLASGQTYLGGDPAVVVSASGRYWSVSTGPLRSDARPGPPLFTKKTVIRR
jgi:hypothetical protein